MAKRFAMGRGRSRRAFSRGNRVHRYNFAGAPMRGGIRA